MAIDPTDSHSKPLLIAANIARSSLTSSLRMALPQDVSSSHVQPATLTPLWQQLLTIATQPDCSQRLAAFAACIGKAFNVDGCAIVLSSTAHTPTQAVCWFADAPPLPLQPLKPATRFDDWMASATPIHCRDVETLQAHPTTASSASKALEIWQFISSLRASSLQVRAVVGTTLHVQERVHGVISLMRSRPHTWAESEITGLQTVSHQVASTVDQLQLQQLLNQQRQYQSVVNRLTLTIHNASDFNTALKLATDGTANALQVQRGLLLRLKHWDALFRSCAQTQTPKISVNIACEWLPAMTDRDLAAPLYESSVTPFHAAPTAVNQSFWLSECALCQQAFLHPESPITLAGDQPPWFESNHGAPAGEAAAVFNLESLPALLLAPLESQGTILGFLVFQHDQPRVWQPEELELVQLVSAQVSTAIIQTETLRQVQSLVERRTAELRESLSVQARLYDRTRHQLDQLRQLNQVRDEFLSTVSHELRTPLTSMMIAIRMLRQVGLSTERSARYLDILEQQCTQETSLVNDLLGLQELESNQVTMHLQEIDLKALLHDLIRLFNQQWAAKGLTLETKLPKRSLRLLSDHDSLHRVLLELLTNAGKYSDPNSRVQLHVTQKKERSTNQMIVTLRNLGQGISPDELPFIFDKFKRCQGATQNAIQGTGLGLALVKSLMQHLNGTITASSRATKAAHIYETCFTLTLPQTFDNSKVL